MQSAVMCAADKLVLPDAGFFAGALLIFFFRHPYGQRYAHGIGIFHGHAAFQADNVVGDNNMIVVGLQQFTGKFGGAGFFAAEVYQGLSALGQLIAGARSANGGESHVRPDGAEVLREALQDAGFGLAQALGDIDERHGAGQLRQHLPSKPVHAKAADAADNQLGARQRLLELLELEKPHVFRQFTGQGGVCSVLTQGLNDMAVQRRAHQVHLMPIVDGRHRHGRTHQSGTNNTDQGHEATPINNEAGRGGILRGTKKHKGTLRV